MSKRAFETRIQGWDTVPASQEKQCECCDRIATHWIRWAFTPFRGDDEVYYACPRHLEMARKQQKRYFAHMRTKESFLNQKSTAEVQP